jgi:hypothetical protein
MCQLRGKSTVIVVKHINLLLTSIINNTWPTTVSKHVYVLKMFQNSLLAALLLYHVSGWKFHALLCLSNQGIRFVCQNTPEKY